MLKYIKYPKEKKFLLLLVVMTWMSIPAWLGHRFSSEQKWCLHDQKARVVEKLGCHAVSQSRSTAFSLWFLLENLFSMKGFSRKFECSLFFYLCAIESLKIYDVILLHSEWENWTLMVFVNGDGEQRRRSLTALQVYRDDTGALTPIRR